MVLSNEDSKACIAFKKSVLRQIAYFQFLQKGENVVKFVLALIGRYVNIFKLLICIFNRSLLNETLKIVIMNRFFLILVFDRNE